MMEDEEQIPNPRIYIPVDLVEDILLRLPLKPILKFKAVSKQWRSTLESKRFAERRRSVQKNPKILVVENLDLKVFQGEDAEIDITYLQRADATTIPPSMTCDGLVCIPVLNWVHVLNPSTGEFLRFPSSPSLPDGIESYFNAWSMLDLFPEFWAMGFGRDEVTGNYKVVNMLFDSNNFEILDVHIGEWRKLSPPPYEIGARRKSACVNGSIYWLDFKHRYHILALDLHTEEFRDLSVLPPKFLNPVTATLVNLEDRLAMAYYTCISHKEEKLEIWSMDAQEETWTRTYLISLSHRLLLPKVLGRRFTPIAVSKQGNLFLSDSYMQLFKYYPETDYLSFVSSGRVITPFVENLVPLRCLLGGGRVPKISTYEYRYGLSYLKPGFVSKISTFVRKTGLLAPSILLTSTLISLVICGYRYKLCS